MSDAAIWAKDKKTNLSPREVLQVAHAALVIGVDQHALAAMFGVNPARVAEAVVAMRGAAEDHMRLYRNRGPR